MSWVIKDKDLIYDSYEDSDYVIFVTKIKDLKCLKNSEFKHIMFNKRQDRIKLFIEYVKKHFKRIIYIKRRIQRDEIRKYAGDLDYDVVEYETSLKDEFEIIKPMIQQKIDDVNNKKEKNKRLLQKKEEIDEDDEFNLEDFST